MTIMLVIMMTIITITMIIMTMTMTMMTIPGRGNSCDNMRVIHLKAKNCGLSSSSSRRCHRAASMSRSFLINDDMANPATHLNILQVLRINLASSLFLSMKYTRFIWATATTILTTTFTPRSGSASQSNALC
jgi:hypothetical protein